MKPARAPASLPFDGVLVKGCVVSVRLVGREEPLVGQVVRALDPISRTAAIWPFGWDDPIVVPVAEVQSVVVPELSRKELAAIRARQRGQR
jgi:hypothetical protein